MDPKHDDDESPSLVFFSDTYKLTPLVSDSAILSSDSNSFVFVVVFSAGGGLRQTTATKILISNMSNELVLKITMFINLYKSSSFTNNYHWFRHEQLDAFIIGSVAN